jgi:hypothetical protein
VVGSTTSEPTTTPSGPWLIQTLMPACAVGALLATKIAAHRMAIPHATAALRVCGRTVIGVVPCFAVASECLSFNWGHPASGASMRHAVRLS